MSDDAHATSPIDKRHKRLPDCLLEIRRSGLMGWLEPNQSTGDWDRYRIEDHRAASGDTPERAAQ
jgi:hypothetical protein